MLKRGRTEAASTSESSKRRRTGSNGTFTEDQELEDRQFPSGISLYDQVMASADTDPSMASRFIEEAVAKLLSASSNSMIDDILVFLALIGRKHPLLFSNAIINQVSRILLLLHH
jgi:hypothetical protein